jgi:hypothetical protein
MPILTWTWLIPGLYAWEMSRLELCACLLQIEDVRGAVWVRLQSSRCRLLLYVYCLLNVYSLINVYCMLIVYCLRNVYPVDSPHRYLISSVRSKTCRAPCGSGFIHMTTELRVNETK